jgi:dihydroxy-acid dehydratase
MLRISDGRMSGTAGGTIVLHISPESADLDSVFGIVQSGDRITCDVEQRVLSLEISEEDIKKRIEARKQKVQSGEATGRVPWVDRRSLRGYRGLYERRVNQAHLGCDFDFLTAEGPQNVYVE